jgi:uncharacterized protein YraI
MNVRSLTAALGVGAAILITSIGSASAAVTTSDKVDVMSGPGANFKIVGTLAADQTVAVSSQNADWCEISGPATGWVACASLNGFTPSRVNAAPANNGYDFNTDPLNGPNAAGSLHSVHGGSFM